MNTQPEALRLADWLENEPGYDWNRNYCLAVAELRRLHEENEALRQALAQPEQEPVGYVTDSGKSAYFLKGVDLDDDTPLYTAPPKQPEQEPVAWVIEDGEVDYYVDVIARIKPGTPLYTAPVDAVNMSQERVDETAKREHEPVAWMGVEDPTYLSFGKPNWMNSIPLYTAPPKREWVGLTDEDLVDCESEEDVQFVKRIEAKLKEKNNG